MAGPEAVQPVLSQIICFRPTKRHQLTLPVFVLELQRLDLSTRDRLAVFVIHTSCDNRGKD